MSAEKDSTGTASQDARGQSVKPQSISGFPEYLPAVRAAELTLLDKVRRVFELHGFCSLETPALERLGATEEEAREGRFALHYDLTVPFARYVAQHFGELSFPFKRYQMQHSWRGERPQDGRFRQFLQCDIDVVGDGSIPLSFDVELAAIMHSVVSELEIGAFALRVSNRKILDGYLEGVGIGERTPVLRYLDKLDKLGPERVLRALCDDVGLPAAQAERALAPARIATADESFAEQLRALGVTAPRMEEGIAELEQVVRELNAWVGGGVRADLSLVRGFDYYTGTVYELEWSEYPGFPSIGAGGRYDDLASLFIRKKLPGVGISLGFTRIFHKLLAEGRLPGARPTPTRVLVTWLDESGPARARAIAQALRERGIAAEVYHEPGRLKKQLQYADRKQIPYVWFDTDGVVKDMRDASQLPADPKQWCPPEEI